MCVSKIKGIYARVTEFCSGNENADAGRTDGRTDDRLHNVSGRRLAEA